MSVTKCQLIRYGRSGSADLDYKREYNAQWKVTTDSGNDGWTTVLLQSGNASLDNPIPDLWSTYAIGNDVDTGVYLQDKRGQPETGSETTWIVTGTWKAPPPGRDPANGDNQPNPLFRPVRYHLEFANFTRVAEKDIFDKAITNSAGQEFDPPLEMDDARPVLVAVKNEWPLEGIISKAIQYKNAVNTNTFYGAGPREAKVESIVSGGMQTENDVRYYPVTYRIQFNHEQWDIELVDQGWMHYGTAAAKNLLVARGGEQNADGTYKIATGETELPPPVPEPIGLDPDGTRRDKDADPVKLFKQPPFRIYPELSFASLGI